MNAFKTGIAFWLVTLVWIAVALAADPVLTNSPNAQIEALQQRNMALQLENAKLRKQLEAQAEEHRQISRARSAEHTQEIRALAQSNAVLRAERKGTK